MSDRALYAQLRSSLAKEKREAAKAGLIQANGLHDSSRGISISHRAWLDEYFPEQP